MCQVYLKMAQRFWRRRCNYKKFTKRQRQRLASDKFRSEKLTLTFRGGELIIKENLPPFLLLANKTYLKVKEKVNIDYCSFHANFWAYLTHLLNFSIRTKINKNTRRNQPYTVNIPSLKKKKKPSLNTICFVPTQNVITILNVIKSK